MRRLLILYASTWGQFGNRNAAGRLARLLQPLFPPGIEIVAQPAEDWCPIVAEAGARMREIASTSNGPAERRTRYMGLIGELEARFPAGLETAGGAHPDVAALAERIAGFDPALIVATKGFLSRLADAALRQDGRDIPLVNYVTNDGLLELPLHRTGPDILNLVQTNFGAGLLADHPRVEVVGPLVGRAEPGAKPVDADERPLVAILCNRNPEYRSLYDALIAKGDSIRVKTIVMGCPDLLAHLRASAPGHWDIWDAQAVETYLDLLQEVGAAPACLLVTKSAPNSVLESVAAGVPVLALDSGLPMESWIGRLVADRRLGWAADDLDGAISILCALLDEPERIGAMAAATRAYAAEAVDNVRNAGLVHRALADEMRTERHMKRAQWQSYTYPISLRS